MSSRFPGSAVLLQEAVGVSNHSPFPSQTQPHHPFKYEYKVTNPCGSPLNALQHTVALNGASDCYWGHVQAYLRGTVPVANITCPQQYIPFIDGSVGSF
jgi:hypothetical protein